MRAFAIAVALVLLLVMGVTAQDSGDQPQGAEHEGAIADTNDAFVGPLDLLALHYTVGPGEISLSIEADGSAGTDTVYTTMVLMGEEGADEPNEWYVLQVTADDQRLIVGHTDPPSEIGPRRTNDNGTVHLTFGRIDAAPHGCIVVATTSSTGNERGTTVFDSLPDGNEQLAEAWQRSTSCGSATEGAATVTVTKDSPAPALAVSLLVLATLIFVVRRQI